MKTQKNIFHLLTLLIGMSLSFLHATEIHVTSMTALQSAINGASAGDTIILANGTYTNSTLTIGKSNITVKSATPGGVYLNGTQSIIINGNYVTFSGFQFTSGNIGSSNNIIEVNGSHDILTQINISGYKAQKYIHINDGTQYNEISYCNIERKDTTAKNCAIQISTSATVPGYHKIRYCSFKKFPGPGGDFGSEPIRIGLGAERDNNSRTLVEYCYFDSVGFGDSESISVKCCENVIRYCTFDNNPEGMLVFRNGDRNVAYGNFFINGSGGIRVKEARDTYCYNNYFETSGASGAMDAIKFDYDNTNGYGLRNASFVHNTFVNCGAIDLGGTGPTLISFANNIFKKSSGNIFTNPNGGTAWAGNIRNGNLGITIPSGMINADPKLELNSDGYYGLSSLSPAINASSSSYPPILDITNINDDPSILLDISGQTRPPTATLKDVGCDEYATGSITNRPLTLSDVGPSYLGGPGSVRVLTLTALIEGLYNGGSITSDTVTAELYHSTSPYTFIERTKLVLDSFGNGNANFFSASDGTNYYIAIKHRNSIETWSKTTQYFSGGVLSYDFTTSANKAYGDNMKLKGTKWCIYNGDINQDGVIDLTDVSNVDLDNLSFSTGYIATDVNGDNLIDLTDLSLVENNNLNFVTKVTP